MEIVVVLLLLLTSYYQIGLALETNGAGSERGIVGNRNNLHFKSRQDLNHGSTISTHKGVITGGHMDEPYKYNDNNLQQQKTDVTGGLGTSWLLPFIVLGFPVIFVPFVALIWLTLLQSHAHSSLLSPAQYMALSRWYY
ncbi:unnamed protein product [Allacma fusca]|uniref:Uncharacterized protein n=1 Tax=Allacma fusca TaxID=39272 RepID=A0A8J2K7Y6_9HEXA|nr:unnamed protein product [Allacma fusca]